MANTVLVREFVHFVCGPHKTRVYNHDVVWHITKNDAFEYFMCMNSQQRKQTRQAKHTYSP